jgi:hypothetical protein
MLRKIDIKTILFLFLGFVIEPVFMNLTDQILENEFLKELAVRSFLACIIVIIIVMIEVLLKMVEETIKDHRKS